MRKFLIINADDFGYNKEQTSAITYLLKNGLISSTSFLSVTPYSEKAVEIAKNEGFSVGVHLTVNSDSGNEGWRSLSESKSICENGALAFNQKKLTFGAKRKEVAAEIEAQYDFLVSRGIKVDHADNHCGTFYGINGRRFYIEAYEFCKKHGLPYRFPKSSAFIRRQLGLGSVPGVVKSFQAHIVKEGTKRGVRLLDDLVSNPWSADKITDCDALKRYYLDAIDECPEGVTEFFLHPAEEKEDPKGNWKKRVFEYDILKSGDLLQKAKEKNIKIISWAEFAQMKQEEFI